MATSTCPHDKQGVAEIIMGLRIIRQDIERLLKLRDGLFRLARVEQEVAEIVMGYRQGSGWALMASRYCIDGFILSVFSFSSKS